MCPNTTSDLITTHAAFLRLSQTCTTRSKALQSMDSREPSVNKRLGKRTRRCLSKSSSGCARCKARRVKCDEARPACGKCTRSGFDCPGYRHQLRWSTKYERCQSFPSATSITQPTWHMGTASTNIHSRSTGEIVQSDDTISTTISREQTSDQYTLHDMASEPAMIFTVETGLNLQAAGASTGRIDPNSTFVISRSINAPEITPSLDHTPTMLIEYWFRHICPLRSTFDSGINYNRQVAWNTWSTSDSVSSTMQAMAAACLVRHKPHLRESLPSLRSQALAAVSLGISQARELTFTNVKADLIFAVLALGTSLHWFTYGPLSDVESSWSQSARGLLSVWRPRLVKSECLLYSYFSQALTYWDMLLAPLGRGSFSIEMRTKRKQLQRRLEDTLRLSANDEAASDQRRRDCANDFLGTRPNSWCGVSSEVINLYGQVLALCHSVSIRTTSADISNIERAYDVLCDMSIARELQRELLAMNFDTLVLLEEAQGFPVQTQDNKTPLLHLLQTAEGFRKAALLQLHLTFEDLPILHVYPGCDSFVDRADRHPLFREDMILKTAMDLAKILRDTPIDSGCTSIHPMLYLAVAVGICSTARSITLPHDNHDETPDFGALTSTFPDPPGTRILQNNDELPPNSLPPYEPSLATEIPEIKLMTLSRLGTLQQMLPHASSGQVLQVVNAIWAAYDDRRAGDSSICWFTIMRRISPGTLLWS